MITHKGIKLGKQVIKERDILGEKNDCIVRALMESLEIPYLEAYGMMIGLGRKRNKGLRIEALVDNICVGKYPRPNMIVENYVRFIAHSGNWIIEIRGHVFAVIGGCIKDEFPSAVLNCHVLNSWRMK